MKKILLLISVLISVTAFAQNSAFEQMFEWTMEEKIKIQPENLDEFQGKAGKQQSTSAQKSANINISDNNTPESEVHAVMNPNDSSQIVVSPISRSSGLHCPVYYSNDFGNTWNKSSFSNMPSIPGNNSIGGGDPVLAYDDSNRVYMSWIDLSIKGMNTDSAYWGLYWGWSDDNGQTWNYDTTQVIVESQGSFGGGANFDGPLADKQWMAVDKNPSSSYYNNLYVCYAEIDAQSQAYRMTLAKKSADSMHFDTTKTYITGNNFAIVQFGSISVDQNGRIHVSFFGSYDNTKFSIFHAYSDDGGQTFSTPQPVSEVQVPQYTSGQQNTSVSGIADDRFYPSVYNACAPNSDNVYITWTANGVNSKDSDGLDVYFTRSTDAGNTFESPAVINDDTSSKIHQYYSSINVAPSGRIDISWYDRREDTSNNINTHYYISSSYDQGQTFGTNAAVSTMSTDFSTVGNQNNDFGVGEYNMVLSTNNYIIPFWADGRQNNGNLNIFAAFVEKNSLSVERLTSMKKNFSITSVYPNPALNRINCEVQAHKPGNIEVSIRDLSGKEVINGSEIELQTGKNEFSLNMNKLTAGAYFLVLESENGQELRKLIKQ